MVNRSTTRKTKSTSNRTIKLIPIRYGSSTYFEHFNDLKWDWSAFEVTSNCKIYTSFYSFIYKIDRHLYRCLLKENGKTTNTSILRHLVQDLFLLNIFFGPKWQKQIEFLCTEKNSKLYFFEIKIVSFTWWWRPFVIAVVQFVLFAAIAIENVKNGAHGRVMLELSPSYYGVFNVCVYVRREAVAFSTSILDFVDRAPRLVY